jgi:glyoxylase-like metal-dependent hydrolase (beta-lactamase superfamily II)
MVEIIRHIHSIDQLEHPFPGLGIVPYIEEERSNDLTLIDTCFSVELPKLEKYLSKAGYRFEGIKRIVLTHVHVDHTQAANEIKKRSGKQRYIRTGLKQAIWRMSPPTVVLLLIKSLKIFFKNLELHWKM